MKLKTIVLLMLIGVFVSAFSQKSTMTLTFTANNYGQYVALNSILIENLTQGGDTTLYAPDTVMVLDYMTSIDENIGDNIFEVSQNYPNPIEGKTTVNFYLQENDNVQITVSDIIGRMLLKQEYSLGPGNHSLTFFPGTESIYFLTVRVNHQSQTIVMVNSPTHSSGFGNCMFEYNGQTDNIEELKAGMNLNNFVFNLGDELKYTASSDLGEQIIIDLPTGDFTYTFQYTSPIPCPSTPTVTDIEDNIYNTVLIGDQCWMKENLKTTIYNNGTPIPNLTNGANWYNTTTGAYVWMDNDISWKDIYGAIYNWFVTVDANGLCPTGWHVPTSDEWTLLTDFIGGTSSPHGNELKSCRQVNSPLGGDCNTTDHPRWNEHDTHYGTDDYGFSGLPSSYRGASGLFNPFGGVGYWWSSSEETLENARFIVLGYDYGNADMYDSFKQFGFSIRCLRD